MRKMVVLTAAALVVVAGALVGSAASQASSAPRFKITGTVVAGVQSAQRGGSQELTFAFTAKNTSSAAQQADFNYSVTNGTAANYICPLVSNHFDIAPDSPACELGSLAPYQTAQSALIVITGNSAGPMTVKMCIQNTTFCKTLTVTLQ